MSFLNLNTAGPCQSAHIRPPCLIPPDEPLWLRIRVCKGGTLTPTRKGNGMNLGLELIVVEGPESQLNKYFTVKLLVEGNGSVSHTSAIEGNRSMFRSIVESSYGKNGGIPGRTLEEALSLDSFTDLDGLRFFAFVTSHFMTDGTWFNKIGRVITPSMLEWPS